MSHPIVQVAAPVVKGIFSRREVFGAVSRLGKAAITTEAQSVGALQRLSTKLQLAAREIVTKPDPSRRGFLQSVLQIATA